ncbi:MAG: hypothetical protein LBO09_08640 [Candidatus Peribacteria bacterium]|jgi:hypothetical protein|nr:hypothetical protein [Candidatus Peribacteria bacterium]
MINFVYDPEKDLKLIQKWKEENYSIRENDEEWLKINKQRQISLIDEYSKIEIDPNNQFIKDYINFIQTEREKVEDNFLKKIGDFFEIQISTMPNIACYLTRSGRYPYYFNHATTIEEAEYLKSRENEQEPKRDMFGIANEEWFACPMFQ